MKSSRSHLTAWGVVPARGGSKSIPGKNLVKLQGRTLVAISAGAGRLSGRLDRVICSTDDPKIARAAKKGGAEIDWRPVHLASDDSPVADMLVELLQRRRAAGETLPDAVVLLQPTSPFVRSEIIGEALDLLFSDSSIQSVQTIAKFPHNLHAFNQRIFSDERVAFKFARQRKMAFNKQRKPPLYRFGNLVVTRSSALLRGSGVFANPSGGILIPEVEAFDLDTADDVRLARWMLDQKMVVLDER